MLRPEELKEREKKEAEKRLRERKAAIVLVLKRAIEEIKLTSEGGEIEFNNYSPYENEDITIIKEFFAAPGWDCRYEPRTDYAWSMTAKSDYAYTRHFFVLKPMKTK